MRGAEEAVESVVVEVNIQTVTDQPRRNAIKDPSQDEAATRRTPCNRCVRFATTVASGHATLATKRTLLLNLGRTFTGWIAPALCWRTHSITSSARSPSSAFRFFEVDNKLEFGRLANWQALSRPALLAAPPRSEA